MHGNTSVHQAAAGGQYDVLVCFLSFGVDVEIKNARGHTPLDLATHEQCKKLLQDSYDTKVC